MSLNEQETSFIDRQSDRIFNRFDKFGGYESIDKNCNFSQLIRIKYWIKHMEKYNKEYWNIVMMMVLYNLGNGIEASVRDVRTYSKTGHYIATALAYEGFDFDFIQKSYRKEGEDEEALDLFRSWIKTHGYDIAG